MVGDCNGLELAVGFKKDRFSARTDPCGSIFDDVHILIIVPSFSTVQIKWSVTDFGGRLWICNQLKKNLTMNANRIHSLSKVQGAALNPDPDAGGR